MPENTYYY